jgi:hypothetical protein
MTVGARLTSHTISLDVGTGWLAGCTQLFSHREPGPINPCRPQQAIHWRVTSICFEPPFVSDFDSFQLPWDIVATRIPFSRAAIYKDRIHSTVAILSNLITRKGRGISQGKATGRSQHYPNTVPHYDTMQR